MAYHEFSLQKIQDKLGLELEDANFFEDIKEYELRQEFLDFFNQGVTLGLTINTEKAKSEFIIAPLLLELKRVLPDTISIFSGIELTIDKEQGLNGVCDFIISQTKRQHFLTAPLITIVEAKNDNLGDGIGQCIAEMYAAQIYNTNQKRTLESIYGIVTTGSAWKFMKLTNKLVRINLPEYFINNPQKIFGILIHITTT